MTNFKHKPHFVNGTRYPLATDAQEQPPVPCEFKVGEKVTFTNDYGVTFDKLTVTGFSPTLEGGRFVYLDKSSWWFPVNPGSLTRQIT